jgi:branched-chain amino acid transport system permease protein
MSLDLLMGYGGLVSFGHAAFFGLGAYGTVLLAVKLGFSVWLSALCGIGVATVAAAAIGFFCVRMTGVAFLMLTLAFAQLIFSVGVKWRAIGGSDGIGGLVKPDLLAWSLADPLTMYLFTLAIFALVLVAMRRLIASQFGHALVGIRENETRMRAMGFPTRNIRLVAFILAGFFASIAGALYAIFMSYIDPSSFEIQQSIVILTMLVIGGARTLAGSLIGPLLLLAIPQVLSLVHIAPELLGPTRALVFGALLVVFMLWRPQGIAGRKI